MRTRDQLLDMIDAPDPFGFPAAELEPMQIEAARELFGQRREQIAVLRRRAEDTGVTEIRTLDDLVPLLFAHTVYKSYPQSFVEKGQWQRMLQWLNTLSVEDTTKTDVAGVTNVDQWVDRLRAAGHRILATSGSSGKCSFLNHTEGDFQKKLRHFRRVLGWPYTRGSNSRVAFFLFPSAGYNSAIEAAQIGGMVWAKPGEANYLTDEPLLISEVATIAAMRTRMAEGTATPSEVSEFNAKEEAKRRRMGEAVHAIADKILAHRHEPIYMTGLWAQHMIIIKRARELGIGDGEFHPDSVVNAGGGVKDIPLPPDYREQVAAFYGKVIRPAAYGMTEMAQMMPRCEAGRYHRVPGLVWLVLDQPGERLLTPEDAVDNKAEGRFAFLDLSFDGRWGGLITGDKVTIDFRERCDCGRPGPTLLDNITRFSQPGQDDHIGCAGTINAYIQRELA